MKNLKIFSHGTNREMGKGVGKIRENINKVGEHDQILLYKSMKWNSLCCVALTISKRKTSQHPRFS